MTKLELIKSIEQELEELGALQVQKENIEHEYASKRFVVFAHMDAEEEKINKSKSFWKKIRKYAILSLIASLFTLGTLLSVVQLVSQLPMQGWMLDAIFYFSSAVMGGSLGVIGITFVYQSQPNNFDKSAAIEIRELEKTMEKIKVEIAIHKNNLKKYKGEILYPQDREELLKQEMIAYYQEMKDGSFLQSNSEMDIAKSPYTK